VQHDDVPVPQAWPVRRHWTGGVSQKQAVPVHGTSCSDTLMVRHVSPLQQLASVVQDCDTFAQIGGGGPHVPELQTSVGLQHGVLVHDWPEFAQVGGGATLLQVFVPPMSQTAGEQHSAFDVQLRPRSGALQQVPDVLPAPMVQVLGEQQSAFTVQLAPPGWQAPPPPVLQTWVMESQVNEQQSAFTLQVAPSPMQLPQTEFSKQ